MSARRLVRFASEDVGNADPRALEVTLAAKEAVHFLGMPEANTALAQAVVYLAAAPKSNAVYIAYGRASKDATEDVASPVPLHLRNAPTRLMKNLGYGQGYRYAHDEPEGVAEMSSLPEHLEGRRYYEPTDRGIEKRIKDALEHARAIRAKRGDRTPPMTTKAALAELKRLSSKKYRDGMHGMGYPWTGRWACRWARSRRSASASARTRNLPWRCGTPDGTRPGC